MDLKEVKELKHQLELDIFKLIKEFEKQTDECVIIEDIELNYQWIMCRESGRVTHVCIKCAL
jgi:hypothetical protein